MVKADIRNNCHLTLLPLLHRMDISPSISVSEYGFGQAWSILNRTARTATPLFARSKYHE